MVLLSHFILARVSYIMYIQSSTKQQQKQSNPNILGFTSFFASLWHQKKLRPE